MSLARAALLTLAACTPLQVNVTRADAADPCGAQCPLGRACVAGRCSDVACAPGRADCDGAPANGCEVDTATHAGHCGGCRRACALPNATSVCVGAQCRVGACAAGRGDCDGDGANGCERDLTSDPAHCGRCQGACAAPHQTATCAAGVCGAPTCERGFGDCDGAADNGCEADLRADPARCGACGAPCPAPAHGVATCAASACAAMCEAGFDRSAGACLPPGAPRLVAPLSARVVGPRPTLRWALGAASDGARVTLCRDRALTEGCRALDAAGSSVRVPEALARGRWFWRATGRRGATALAAGATWGFTVGARASEEVAASPLADVDGDGFDDVVVGAPGVSVAGASYVGAWSLFPGRATGLPSSPTRVATGTFVRDVFGSALALGDFDGDGLADLAASAPAGGSGEGGHPGVVRAYRGGSAGPAGSAQLLQGAAPAFGEQLVSAGDVDGDGFGDLAVTGPPRAGEAPAVSVFRGRAAGLGEAPAQVLRGLGAVSLSGGADLQRDGFDDLLVGAFDADPGGRADAGSVAVYAGGAAALGATAVWRVEGEAPGDHLGRSVAMLGDVDGDGFDDFAVGAPGARGGAGQVRVYAGAAGPPTLARTLDGAAGEGFGRCVARVGDVDGDGRADLAVGATAALGERGRVWLYLSGASGIHTAAARVWDGAAAGEGFGELVVGVGNVNGDGYADLAVTARGAHLDADGVGRVWVYAGAAAGPAATASWVLDGARRSDSFGSAVARRVRRGVIRGAS